MIESAGGSPNTGRLPAEVEELAPGPELARLLAGVDRRALSERDRVRLLRARQRLVSHVQAELMADLCAVTWEDEPEPDGSGGYAWAETEIACALRWTSVAAGRRLAQARQVIEEFPAVGRALSSGWIDAPRALVITELVESMPDRRVARALVERVVERAGEWSTGQLRARLRRLVLAADPGWASRRAAEAVRGRRVEVLANEDGSGELWGRSLPSRDVAVVWERLTAVASAAKSAGDKRNMAQLRADAMLDLLAGEGVAVGGPVGRHSSGLPVADGYPGEQPSPDRPHPDRPHPDQPNPDQPGSEQPGDGGVCDGVVWPAVLPEPPDAQERWAGDRAVTAAAAAVADPAATAASSAAGPVALPGPRRGVVELQVPLTTLIGLTELPGELRGFGPVVADVARQVAGEQLAGAWRYSLLNDLGEVVCHGPVKARPTDPGTAQEQTEDQRKGQREGQRKGQRQGDWGDWQGDWQGRGRCQARHEQKAGQGGRRPTAAVAAVVRARNPTCVAPGCRRPARSCDLDHTVDWADGGSSTADNLGPLCRRHHRFKHDGGAEVIQPVPGVFGWTTPRGLQYVTTPEPALTEPALTQPALTQPALPEPP